MLFKQTFGHEYCWAAVAQESCCKRLHEAGKMREKGLESLGPVQRGRKKNSGESSPFPRKD